MRTQLISKFLRWGRLNPRAVPATIVIRAKEQKNLSKTLAGWRAGVFKMTFLHRIADGVRSRACGLWKAVRPPDGTSGACGVAAL